MGKATTPVLETQGTGLSISDAETLLAAAKEIREAVEAIGWEIGGRIEAVEAHLKQLEHWRDGIDDRFGCTKAGFDRALKAAGPYGDGEPRDKVESLDLHGDNFAELTGRVASIESTLWKFGDSFATLGTIFR